jgi:hypothetical protein
MATREHRSHHFLWHLMRTSWMRLTAPQRRALLARFPGWEPPRPALDADGQPIRDNNSGEDFLYMHRQMIATVNEILARVGDPSYPKVEGWENSPAPDDPDYPVPELTGLEDVKSASYYHQTMKPLADRFTDPSYLRSVTLGQLGSDLEFDIHNDLHMRWAGPSAVGFRPRTPVTEEIDPRWDDPAYDYLGDTYSSHVNPIFWKLHGWVDNRIEDWRLANGIEEIQWTGTWEGAAAHDHHGLSRGAVGRAPDAEALDEVVRILADADVFDGFFRPRSRRIAA